MNIWAGTLRLFNLFQFLNYGFFTTTSGVESKTYDLLKYNIEVETDKSSIWSAVYEEVQDEAKPLVKLLSKEGLPLPEVGYELCDEKGMIVAECELAWVQEEIAVVIDDPIEIDGWKVFTIGESEAIIESIKQKVKA